MSIIGNLFINSIHLDSNNSSSLFLQTDGNYIYKINNETLQYLGEGESLIDKYSIYSYDGMQKNIEFVTIEFSNYFKNCPLNT